ncbi:MAG TPA: GldG family protein [Chthoniobacterales bacterium]|nr:GldG family protein [Chthoniobacterales bacterium]
MAADNLPTAKPQEIHRVRIGLNVLVQVAIVLVLALMVNYLGFEHYRRWDLTRDQKFALSDKTRRFLQTMKAKARITVLFLSSDPIASDVQGMLTEFQYAAKKKLDVEHINLERNPTRAKELFNKYKVVSGENLLILDYEGRNKTVKASEMAEIDPGQPMFGDPPKVLAFKGEQAVTSALMELVEGTKNTLGYVVGHKEPSIAEAPAPNPMAPETKSSPIRVMKIFIENENVQFQELNLFEVGAIPAELKAVMIAGPQYDLSDRELGLLRAFWEKQGRILLLLDPAAKTPKLHAFLNELGVKVNDDRLMAWAKTGIQEVALVRDVQAVFLGESPITKRLAEARSIFPGGVSSLTLEPDRVRAANIRLQPLVRAEKGYWAETDYNSDDQAKFQANALQNGEALHTIAVSIEKGGSGDERVQTNSSRLVVVSNAMFIEDSVISQGQQPLDFISGCVNWLLNREQLIGIAPKIPQTLTFSLDENALRNLRWMVLVMMPLIPAVLGLAVWWRRRT